MPFPGFDFLQPVPAGPAHRPRRLPDGRARLRGSSPFTFRGVSHMSDLLFVGLTVVVFAVIGLVAKGVDRL